MFLFGRKIDVFVGKPIIIIIISSVCRVRKRTAQTSGFDYEGHGVRSVASPNSHNYSDIGKKKKKKKTVTACRVTHGTRAKSMTSDLYNGRHVIIIKNFVSMSNRRTSRTGTAQLERQFVVGALRSRENLIRNNYNFPTFFFSPPVIFPVGLSACETPSPRERTNANIY